MIATAVLGVLVSLSACSGDDPEGSTSTQGPTQTPTTSQSPTPSVAVPEGVVLTDPGSALAFGDTATVAYAPEEGISTVLAITVEGSRPAKRRDIEHGFVLDTDYKKNANYFYVDVMVENLGTGKLGRRDVPVWGVSQDDHLLPPVLFDSAFPKCPSKRLPKNFGQGKTFQTCLVFPSPDGGDLVGVRYQQAETDQPIDWS